MKIQKPLLKRQKKGAVKITTYKPFSFFSTVSPLVFFYFIFNAILSKEILNFEISMNLTAYFMQS